MQSFSSVRMTMNFDPLVLPQCSGMLHHRDGRCGELEGDLLLVPPASAWSLGNELNQKCRQMSVVVSSRVPSYSRDLLCPPASWGSPSTTFCGDHYPPLDITGLLWVAGIRFIQSIHPRKGGLLGKLRKLRFRKDPSLFFKMP